MVIGAGVVGSVYAGRLAAAGHDVSLVARGTRREVLEADGLRLESGGKSLAARPRFIGMDEVGTPVDLTLVAVRATQVGSILEDLTHLDSPAVAFLQHLGPHAEEVRSAVGAERAVLAFPGLGGRVRPDGSVEYAEVSAQPTTIDATAAQALVLRTAIDSTGMRTELEPDMLGWFATHEVFIASLGAGILSRAGEPSALAADSAQLRAAVRSIREGFIALEAQGSTVTPSSLRVLFRRLPLVFAAAYFRRSLRGPVGEISLGPHVRASRDDEFAALCARVLDRVGEPLTTPTLVTLLEPYARAAGR